MYVFLENKGALHFDPIIKHLKSADFPFEELSVFTFNAKGNAVVCQLLPVQDQAVCIEVERQKLFLKVNKRAGQ